MRASGFWKTAAHGSPELATQPTLTPTFLISTLLLYSRSLEKEAKLPSHLRTRALHTPIHHMLPGMVRAPGVSSRTPFANLPIGRRNIACICPPHLAKAARGLAGLRYFICKFRKLSPSSLIAKITRLSCLGIWSDNLSYVIRYVIIILTSGKYLSGIE